MTAEKTPVTSRETLNAELREVLRRAYEGGVDVEGGFECRNGVEHPDWDVIVTEVEKDDCSE